MPCDCKTVVEGAVGLTKAILHIDRADDATIAARRDICRNCDQAELRTSKNKRLTLTVLSRCKACGCVVSAKTAIKSEVCPLLKW